MKIEYPEEEMLLHDDEYKYDDVIYEEGGGFAVLWRTSIQSRPVERL